MGTEVVVGIKQEGVWKVLGAVMGPREVWGTNVWKKVLVPIALW